MSKCSAPVNGHRDAASAAKCPVHGPHVARAVVAWNIAQNFPPVPSASHSDNYQARHPATPPKVLETLAGSRNNQTRQCVAENPSCPAQVLVRLANDRSYTVQLNAVGNPSIPPGALAYAAMSEFDEKRAAVAKNPATPPGVLATLGMDKSATVLQRVTENPNVPPEMLTRLGRHEDRDVHLAALSAVRVRLGDRFDIDSENHAALEFLLDYPWWEMKPGDPAVVLALSLYPNP